MKLLSLLSCVALALACVVAPIGVVVETLASEVIISPMAAPPDLVTSAAIADVFQFIIAALALLVIVAALISAWRLWRKPAEFNGGYQSGWRMPLDTRPPSF